MESDYSDTEALKNAIEWYEKFSLFYISEYNITNSGHAAVYHVTLVELCASVKVALIYMY